MNTIKNIFLLAFLIMATPVFAYIGPGAGIPFIGSFIGFIVTVVLVIAAILFWPIRKLLKKKKATQSQDQNDSIENSDK